MVAVVMSQILILAFTESPGNGLYIAPADEAGAFSRNAQHGSCHDGYDYSRRLRGNVVIGYQRGGQTTPVI